MSAPATRENIEQAAARHEFGKPSAQKRGRNPRFPYVPVILHDATVGSHRTEVRQEQILAKAFVTRDEAVAHAADVIEQRRRSLIERLGEQRMRALREDHGLERELPETNDLGIERPAEGECAHCHRHTFVFPMQFTETDRYVIDLFCEPCRDEAELTGCWQTPLEENTVVGS